MLVPPRSGAVVARKRRRLGQFRVSAARERSRSFMSFCLD